MTRERHCFQYGQEEIKYDIVRRPRKTLEIAVEPDASVVIAAPEDATLATIEAKLRKRAAWVTPQVALPLYRVRFLNFAWITPSQFACAGQSSEHPLWMNRGVGNIQSFQRDDVEASKCPLVAPLF